MDGETRSAPLEESCSILRFRIGRVELALFSEHVEEVTEPSEVTPIPCAPKHVPGLVAVRGEALPLFDVALFLSLPGAGEIELPRMLIVHSPPFRVGVLCEQVFGVTAVPRRAVQEARISGPPSLRRYAIGEVETREGVAPVLDVAALLAAGRAQ